MVFIKLFTFFHGNNVILSYLLSKYFYICRLVTNIVIFNYRTRLVNFYYILVYVYYTLI